MGCLLHHGTVACILVVVWRGVLVMMLRLVVVEVCCSTSWCVGDNVEVCGSGGML